MSGDQIWSQAWEAQIRNTSRPWVYSKQVAYELALKIPFLVWKRHTYSSNSSFIWPISSAPESKAMPAYFILVPGWHLKWEARLVRQTLSACLARVPWTPAVPCLTCSAFPRMSRGLAALPAGQQRRAGAFAPPSTLAASLCDRRGLWVFVFFCFLHFIYFFHWRIIALQVFTVAEHVHPYGGKTWDVCFTVSQRGPAGLRSCRPQRWLGWPWSFSQLSPLRGLTSVLPHWRFPHLWNKPPAIKSLSQGLLLGVLAVSCCAKCL